MSDELDSIDLSGLEDDDVDDAMEIEEEEEEEEMAPSSSPASIKRKAADLEADEHEQEEADEEEDEEDDVENSWSLPPHIQKAVDVLDQGLHEARERYLTKIHEEDDKGKEEEVPFDDDEDDIEFDEMFAADSEDLQEIEERRKRLAVLQKLDQASAASEKPKNQKQQQQQQQQPQIEKKKMKLKLKTKEGKTKEGKKSVSEDPKKKRQKTATKGKGRPSTKKKATTTKNDPSLFPNANDMVGLMAYIQSSGYDIICNGSQEGELSAKNKEEVSDEVYALANLFGKRLNSIKDGFMDNFKKAIIEKGKTRGQDPTKLVALITAIQKYRRMITPLGEDLKPKSQSPWTGAEISGDDAHNLCTRIVIVPDEEEANPIVFYENDEVTGLYKTIHTLCHFGAYLRIDLDRIINKAKKAVDDSEDPDVLWEAVFDPKGDVPAKTKDQKEGTRLIALKQKLLVEMCKMLRKFSLEMGASGDSEDPFKCN